MANPTGFKNLSGFYNTFNNYSKSLKKLLELQKKEAALGGQPLLILIDAIIY